MIYCVKHTLGFYSTSCHDFEQNLSFIEKFQEENKIKFFFKNMYKLYQKYEFKERSYIDIWDDSCNVV